MIRGRRSSGTKKRCYAGQNSVRSIAKSPWVVAGLALLVYGLWILSFLARGHEARDFIRLGRRFVQQSQVSSVIRYDPAYPYPGDGYDGQFAYYIAVDPSHARYYMDDPAYRYGRIPYPVSPRPLPGGRPDLVPYALILINWLAIGMGTLVAAAWLRSRQLWPGIALVYAFYPGLYISLRDDLTEALSYALVALAVYLFDFGGRRRVVWAGLIFALAILSRETAALFAVPYAIALLFADRDRRRLGWRPAATLAALALAPFVAYKVFLLAWLGGGGAPIAGGLEPLPLLGIASYWPWTANQVEQGLAVVLPACLCAGLGIWALSRRLAGVEVWVLLANVLVLVLFLGRSSYLELQASGRVTIGVVLAAVHCVPPITRLGRGGLLGFSASVVLWLSPLPFRLLRRLLALS